MPLHIDTSHAFRTTAEREDLAQAVHGAAPHDECRWLEWKSELDLSVSVGLFKLAKVILGFANRDPHMAMRTAEGTAYLLIGVEPNRYVGMPPIDGATLSQKLKTYIGGADGPRWDLSYITLQGKTILIITIEAPRYGDRIYTLRKAFEKFYPGTVFIRGASESEPAGPGDIAMLEDRLLKGQRQPQMRISLHAEMPEGGFRAVDISPAAVEAWIAAREKALEALVPSPRDHKIDAKLFGVDLAAVVSGTSTAQVGRFLREINEHLDECQELLSTVAIDELIASARNKLNLIVENDSDETIPGVQLTVLILSDAAAAYDELSGRGLPKPPNLVFSSIGLSRLLNSNRLTPMPLPYLGPGHVQIEHRSGNMQLTFAIGDLRPHQVVDCSSVTLIPEGQGTNPIAATWSAASTGRTGVVAGTLTIPVAIDDPIALAEVAGDPADLES